MFTHSNAYRYLGYFHFETVMNIPSLVNICIHTHIYEYLFFTDIVVKLLVHRADRCCFIDIWREFSKIVVPISS